MKSVDMRKSIYDLTEQYPEIIEIMKSLGFKDIVNPILRRTAGKAMTITAGCKMKGIEYAQVKVEFEKNGFEVLE